MVWVYKENNSCASTAAMIDELYDWITRTDAGPTFPVGGAFTAGIRGDVIGTFTLPFSSGSTVGRFASPNSSNLGGRNRTYRFTRGGVDYWFLLDTASQGGSPALPNLGLYCWVTTDTGKTSAQFQALVNAAYVATPSSPTFPYASACYPTHGATKYRFFTDGQVVHVAFKRSHPSASSWQHFTFGKIEKPAGATWAGGEYFFGCDASHNVATGWDLTAPAALAPSILLSNTDVSDETAFNSLATQSPFRKGQIRVAGAYDNSATPKAVNYCSIGWPLPNVVTPITSTLVGKVWVLGGGGYYENGAAGGVSAKSSTLLSCGPNSWNGRSPGVGVDFFYHDTQVTRQLQYLGSIPGVRFVMMDNITEDVPLNQDWVVYPISNVTTLNATYSDYGHTRSGRLGIAYKLP